MNRIGVAIALWLALAFVTWNVIFDRSVADAATAFTREQIVRYQQGQTLTSIHAGFSPRVALAAWHASLWVSPIVVAGGLAIFSTFRRTR
jgi:hypothetical protein